MFPKVNSDEITSLGASVSSPGCNLHPIHGKGLQIMKRNFGNHKKSPKKLCFIIVKENKMKNLLFTSPNKFHMLHRGGIVCPMSA